ncbi:unknown [Clostridium sp. CAG:793]|nr:unknown [Clostridium sp. CAG:793]
MSIIKRTIIMVFLFMIMLFSSSVFASGVNMNLSSESNVVNNYVRANTSISNTSVVIKSVNEVDDSTAGIGFSDVLNILLIAVGFVLILLAVAILIRLK